MRFIDHPSPTIDFLSTWSVYEGTTVDNYTRTLLQGIGATARDHHCNLLLGCGIGLPSTPRGSRTAWATPGATADFVPVGPWNTDGLIIIPDDFTDAQFKYVQDLIHAGYPVVLTTAEEPGPTVVVSVGHRTASLSRQRSCRSQHDTVRRQRRYAGHVLLQRHYRRA